jgi:hypothetical protein
MAEILTNNFKSDVNKTFIIDAKANEDYYMFVSSIGTFNPVDSAVSQNEFLENTLFAKKIKNEDINFMIRYYPWQRGTVYTQYDDAVDLTGTNFYAVVGPNDNDTGDYRIYKCLDNNNGGAAESPPTFDNANLNQIYETADGYVWKYMYRLTTLQFEGYNALGYIPIDPSATIEPAEVSGGGISDIEVTNSASNQGYQQKYAVLDFIFGRTGGINVHGEVSVRVDPLDTTWSSIDNYYVGQYLYITNPSSSVTNLFRIDYYKYNTSTGKAEIRVGPELSNPNRGNVEGATQANPVVITSTDHGLSQRQPIRFKDVGGMTELNDDDGDGNPVYYVDVIDTNNFSLKTDTSLSSGLNGSGFGAFTSGGTWEADKDLVTAGVKTQGPADIIPRIDIKGDGVGAVAIPVIDGDRIASVTVLNAGSGYNNVIAEVVDPIVDFNPDDPNSTDVRAVIRPIIEPKGGHAYNLIDELKCKHFSMYAYITADDNTNIGDVNTYGSLGIVRTPSFRDVGAGTWRSGQANTALIPDIFDNRIAITTDDWQSVTANSIVTQVDGSNQITFTAQVHEIDDTANTIYLAEYMGPYQNNKLVGNGDTSFNPNLDIVSDTGQRITINNPVDDNIVYSDYIQRTGEVYFMEDFFPLARTDLSREEFKFVLEF